METKEKFNKFSHTVMKEADEKKKEIIAEAETQHKEAVASGEIRFLKDAYERIHAAVRKIEKEVNEEVSKAILESKQALFNRREEIISSVFENVKKRIRDFRQQSEYKALMARMVSTALEEVGGGNTQILADNEDLALLEEIRASMGQAFEVQESEELLSGGFLIVNRERGRMCDYSFTGRLKEERSIFLERYGISID